MCKGVLSLTIMRTYMQWGDNRTLAIDSGVTSLSTWVFSGDSRMDNSLEVELMYFWSKVCARSNLEKQK